MINQATYFFLSCPYNVYCVWSAPFNVRLCGDVSIVCDHRQFSRFEMRSDTLTSHWAHHLSYCVKYVWNNLCGICSCFSLFIFICAYHFVLNVKTHSISSSLRCHPERTLPILRVCISQVKNRWSRDTSRSYCYFLLVTACSKLPGTIYVHSFLSPSIILSLALIWSTHFLLAAGTHIKSLFYFHFVYQVPTVCSLRRLFRTSRHGRRREEQSKQSNIYYILSGSEGCIF